MKYPTRLSDAAHILIFIYLNPNSDLSSSAIATSIQTHPSYVRQLMSALKKAHLLEAKQGAANPKLYRPLEQISLLDVYRAVEGDKPLLHQDTHTNPECNVGVQIQLSLKDCFEQIQKRAEEEMKHITLKTVLELFQKKVEIEI